MKCVFLNNEEPHQDKALCTCTHPWVVNPIYTAPPAISRNPREYECTFSSYTHMKCIYKKKKYIHIYKKKKKYCYRKNIILEKNEIPNISMHMKYWRKQILPKVILLKRVAA